jgi:hypothetical protein
MQATINTGVYAASAVQCYERMAMAIAAHVEKQVITMSSLYMASMT